MSAAAKVLVSKDRKTIKLIDGAWSETISAQLLDSRLAMYRSLRDRKGGKYAEFYRHMVEALERAQSLIRAGAASSA